MVKAAAVLLFSATGAFALYPQTQTTSFDQAKEIFQQHRWSEAAAAFAECEKTNPGKTDALLYRGKALVNLGHFDDAEVALGSFRQTHPESDDSVYLLAYVRFRQDKPKESLQLFSDAAKLRPPSADDLKIVALDYVLLQAYSDAARYLEISVKMDPANAEVWYHLGRVRYQQNRFDEAIEAFQHCVRSDPENIKANDNLGLSFEAKNQVEDAITSYSKAIALDKNAPAHSEQPYVNLGSLMLKANRAEEAVPLLVRAVEIAPDLGKIRYELGKAYFNLNKFEDARRETEKAVSMDPKDSSGHYLLGRIYQRLGKTELAGEQFRMTAEMVHARDASPNSGMASGMGPH